MKTSEIVLIQLIGEQTIPNILPVNRLKPQKVYNLCTDKTEHEGLRINRWIANKFQGSIRPQLRKLRGEDLYIATRRACEELLTQHAGKRIIMNLTGGTKLMSLAMYQAAETVADAMVIYIQSGQEPFYHVKSADWEDGFDREALPTEKLSIIDLLEVCEQRLVYNSIKDWHPCVAAARAVQQLADNISTEGLTTHISASNKNRKLLSRLRKACLQDPQLAKSFAAAGCVFTLNSAGETINSSFLTGMWWEVLVADYLERTGNYREVLCSIQTYISEECGLTDVDVLATDGLTLTCFSCKRQLPKPDSEINKHEARSRKLGGIHARKGIAVYHGNEDSFDKLKSLAKAAKMECIIGTDVCPEIKIAPPVPPAPVAPQDILMQGRDCSVESFLS